MLLLNRFVNKHFYRNEYLDIVVVNICLLTFLMQFVILTGWRSSSFPLPAEIREIRSGPIEADAKHLQKFLKNLKVTSNKQCEVS